MSHAHASWATRYNAIMKWGRILLVAALGLGVVVAVGYLVFRRQIATWYYLREAHHHPDSVGPWYPLCKLGADVQPALVRAARRSGPDARGDRTVAVEALFCLRRAQDARVVGSDVGDTPSADIPLEPEVVEAIGEAYDAESDAEARSRMITFLNELDFRFQYAVWARLAGGRHPDMDNTLNARVPDVEQTKHANPAVVRAEWCRVVAPVLRKRLANQSHDPLGGRGMNLYRVYDLSPFVRHACDPGDPERLAAFLQPRLMASAAAPMYAMSVIAAAGANAPRWLAPYFAPSTKCEPTRELYEGAKFIDNLPAPVVDAFGAANVACLRERCPTAKDDASCRAELLAGLRHSP